MQPAVAAPLGGVNRADQGNLKGVLEHLGAGCHQPIVGVNKIETALVQKLNSLLHQVAVLQIHLF